MEHVKYKCRKCGHLIEIPDKTESVLCGKCTSWNRPHSLFKSLNSELGEMPTEGSILQKVPGPIISEVPGANVPESPQQNVPDDDAQSKPGIFSVVALLFFLAPLVSIIVSKLKLPPVVTFAVLAVVFAIYQAAKKRS